MSDEFFPRKDLFLNKDADAWAEQFHLLFYVLHMTPLQIAQIDYGVDPEHPAARLVAMVWAFEIERDFPRVKIHPWTGNFSMTTDELAARLIDLRAAMTSVLGFHEVMDAGDATTPLDAMRHQVFFNAASVELARKVLLILADLSDEAGS